MTKLEIFFAILGTILSIIGIVVGIIGAKSLYLSNKNKNEIKNISESDISIDNSINNGLSSEDLAVINSSFVDNTIKLQEFIAEEQKNNLKEIIGQTLKSLKDENVTNTTPIEYDWQLKFFKYASSSSDKNIQAMWAKLLEAKMTNKSPVSFRTMELISNLSPDEALLFERITDYGINVGKDGLILKDYLNEKKYIKLEEILILMECGLISNESLLQFEMGFVNNQAIITNEKYLLLCSPKGNQEKIIFSIYGLTRAGNEIYKSLGKEISDERFKAIAKWIKNKESQFNISLHKVNFITQSGINYNEKDIIDL